MTRAESHLGDNGGRCEGCDRPESRYEVQQAVPIRMTDGQGGTMPATMWLCPVCIANRDAQKAGSAG